MASAPDGTGSEYCFGCNRLWNREQMGHFKTCQECRDRRNNHHRRIRTQTVASNPSLSVSPAHTAESIVSRSENAEPIHAEHNTGVIPEIPDTGNTAPPLVPNMEPIAPHHNLHIEILQKFASTQNQMQLATCFVCNESHLNSIQHPLPISYLTSIREEFNLRNRDIQKACNRCYNQILNQTKYRGIPVFSKLNDMDPGEIPSILKDLGDLTPIECMLLARVHPIVKVYRVRGEQWKMGSAHIINFFQDVTVPFRTIPRLLLEVPIVIVRKTHQWLPLYKDFKVSIPHLQSWIQFLKQSNRYYLDVEVDNLALSQISELLQEGSIQATYVSEEPEGFNSFADMNEVHQGPVTLDAGIEPDNQAEVPDIPQSTVPRLESSEDELSIL
ncbi:hypothetical protein L873DRAFT_1918419 [Choiromyces venosus 120613-1]|uniref:DUF6570 domain-containing protein n=1 Tax=Choiromyces venosus 120613-1 TaxID=1336337 RepID=A0A3N4JMR1_9PEZI|nr:hypothetical protein L873DRAFT_1918419 [Choiromyces venosus 120613-1]